MSENVVRERDGRAEVWCPGCAGVHRIDLGMWEMDGSLKRPTFYPEVVGGTEPHCGAVIRDGKWYYNSRSSHSLAGQTVAMIPVGDWQ